MRVIIADSQTTVRRALSIWFSGQPGWIVIGESSNSSDLLETLKRCSPEVIIIDSDLPGLSSQELVVGIRELSKDAVIIMLVNNSTEQLHLDALDIDYCISKIDPQNRMLEAILKTRHG